MIDTLFRASPVIGGAEYQGNGPCAGDDLTRFFDKNTLRQARAIIFGRGRQYGFNEKGEMADKQPGSSPELRSKRGEEQRETEALWLGLDEGWTPQKKELIGAVVALLHRGIKEELGTEEASRLSEHMTLKVALNARLLAPELPQGEVDAEGEEGKGTLRHLLRNPGTHQMSVSESMIHTIDSTLGVIDAMMEGTYEPPAPGPDDEYDVWATENPEERLSQLIALCRRSCNAASARRFHNSHTRAVNFLRACNEMQPSGKTPVIEVQDIASFVGSVFLRSSRALTLTVDPDSLAAARKGLKREQGKQRLSASKPGAQSSVF